MAKWLLFLGTIVFGLVAWSGVASAQERCPFSVTGEIAAGDPTQNGRLKQGNPSACNAPKTVPDLQVPVQARRYDAYTLRNRTAAAACVTITVTATTNGAPISSAAYLGTFDPANPQTNYLGDSGLVGAGTPVSYGVNVPAGAAFVVTVNETNPNGGGYTLGVADCGSVIVTAVAPNSGPITGGTAITITGSGFVTGATVAIGGNAATNVTVTNEGSLTATTPAGTAGGANVVVTNPDGSSSTLAGGFVYVAPAQTTLTLASSANPSVSGQNVTFTATASSPIAVPITGTVTFKDGTTDLGTGTLTNGVATFSTSTLAIGTHSITATYAGSGSHSAATSGVVSQVVTTAATTTTLTATPNPVVVGNAVTFNVTVAATPPASGTPTGTVTVSSDGTPVGSPVALDATGKATLSASSLTAGTHTILATYAGDTKFASSVSAPVTLRVDATTDGGTSSSGGSSGTSGTSSSGGSSGASSGTSGGAPDGGPGGNAFGEASGGGGCECNTTSSTSLGSAAVWALTALFVLGRRRKK